MNWKPPRRWARPVPWWTKIAGVPGDTQHLAQGRVGRHDVRVPVAVQAIPEGARVQIQVRRQVVEMANRAVRAGPLPLGAEHRVVIVEVAALVTRAPDGPRGQERVRETRRREVVKDELGLPGLDVGQVYLWLDLQGESHTGGALVVAELHDRDRRVRIAVDHALRQIHQLLIPDIAQVDGHAGRRSATPEGELRQPPPRPRPRPL